MKNLSFFILFALLSGCTHEAITDLPDETETDGKTISFNGFTLKAPSNWYGFKLQGIDSQVGGVTNAVDTLYFDFGWYSYDFSDLQPSLYTKTKVKVNGKEALIVKPIQPGQGLIGIYIKLEGEDRFNLYGVSKNEDEVLRICKSVNFL
ncbi:hypothetical protein ACFP1I_16010 [Dyadobacter subterraneus]|uniref:Lipoprotein n=1 Tax=Dyadobacter subterraneus TaxID=2773304 RepID=A0ABR9WLV1_9BACT|nr:hypothetical protein [Dyadobacter subterraneus]MBE9465139.1 hypothetical protein [Dyadobacter subterraneus]